MLNGSENVLPISLTLECSFPFKVSNLKDMVEHIAGTQSQMEGTVAILTDQLKNLRAFETKLNDIEQQQQKLAKQLEASQRTVDAHDKALSNLTANQESCQLTVETHDKALSNLTTSQESCQQTVEAHDKDIANLKTRVDDLTTASDPIPTDEGKTNQVLLLFFICTSHDVSAKSVLIHRAMQNTQTLNV